MKSASHKPGKRTHTLKEILERQELLKDNHHSTHHAITATTANLFEIKEDLPLSNKAAQLDPENAPLTLDALSLTKSINLFKELIEKETACAAQLLKIDELELKA